MSHDIHLEGDGVDQKFALERGNMHTVDLKPEKPGIIEIECYTHQPAMKGEIVVLPNSRREGLCGRASASPDRLPYLVGIGFSPR